MDASIQYVNTKMYTNCLELLKLNRNTNNRNRYYVILELRYATLCHSMITFNPTVISSESTFPKISAHNSDLSAGRFEGEKDIKEVQARLASAVSQLSESRSELTRLRLLCSQLYVAQLKGQHLALDSESRSTMSKTLSNRYSTVYTTYEVPSPENRCDVPFVKDSYNDLGIRSSHYTQTVSCGSQTESPREVVELSTKSAESNSEDRACQMTFTHAHSVAITPMTPFSDALEQQTPWAHDGRSGYHSENSYLHSCSSNEDRPNLNTTTLDADFSPSSTNGVRLSFTPSEFKRVITNEHFNMHSLPTPRSAEELISTPRNKDRLHRTTSISSTNELIFQNKQTKPSAASRSRRTRSSEEEVLDGSEFGENMEGTTNKRLRRGSTKDFNTKKWRASNSTKARNEAQSSVSPDTKKLSIGERLHLRKKKLDTFGDYVKETSNTKELENSIKSSVKKSRRKKSR